MDQMDGVCACPSCDGLTTCLSSPAELMCTENSAVFPHFCDLLYFSVLAHGVTFPSVSLWVKTAQACKEICLGNHFDAFDLLTSLRQ